jgi:5-methylthioribose kinase
MADLSTVGRFVGGAGYAPLTETSLRALVSGVPACRDLLKGDPVDWTIGEVGDGNLNPRLHRDRRCGRRGRQASTALRAPGLRELAATT